MPHQREHGLDPDPEREGAVDRGRHYEGSAGWRAVCGRGQAVAGTSQQRASGSVSSAERAQEVASLEGRSKGE
jgi:hypothetical protein